LTKVITGVKFKDGVEVTEIDLVAALFRSQNTTFGNNSINDLSMVAVAGRQLRALIAGATAR
jgi:hypothetical protein